MTRSAAVQTLLRLLAVALLNPAGSYAQDAQFFQAPSEKPRLVFLWDALARYDVIDHLRFRPGIERLRLEVRPELDLVFSDRFKIGARAVRNLGTDHNEDNANFDNRSRGASLERYYVEAKPGRATIGGQLPGCLVASRCSGTATFRPSGGRSLELPRAGLDPDGRGGGFYGPQRGRPHAHQGTARLPDRGPRPARPGSRRIKPVFYPDGLKAVYIRQNYSVIVGGKRVFVSKFHVADGIVRLRFPLGRLPVIVSLDGAVNLGVAGEAAQEREKSAVEASVSVGSVGKPGDWRAFYTYQYVERDALLGAYTTDDWWFHSWHRGSRAGIAFTILPQVFVQGTVMFQKRLDLPVTLNRVTADLVKMF